MQNVVLVLCIVHCALCISCGVPNLESPSCAEARVVAKQFYSFHFGNDMRASVDGYTARQKYLTPRYFESLLAAPEGDTDQFTMTREYPRTFKIGECREESPTDVDLQIQIYWRDDEKTVQQEVVANMVKESGKWLLDGVSSRKR